MRWLKKGGRMMSESKGKLTVPVLEEQLPAAANSESDDFTCNPALFDVTTASMLLSIFESPGEPDACPNTARVKFMITMQDEQELRALGYSQAQINTLKPQEAEDILKAAAK